MKYSRWPIDVKDEDILNVFLTGIVRAVCCNCGRIIKMEVMDGAEKFTCPNPNCQSTQYLPWLNPEEFEARKMEETEELDLESLL